MMTNCDHVGWVFLSHSQMINGLFFLLTIKCRILCGKRPPEVPIYAEIHVGYDMMTSFLDNNDVT